MSIFGWTVAETAPAAGTAAARASIDRTRSRHVPEEGGALMLRADGVPQREIFDVIRGTHRYVPAVATRSTQAVYTKLPCPPKERAAPVTTGGAVAARSRGAAVAALLRDPDAADLTPRFARTTRDDPVVDANPSTYLALSHAYNRRVFSRGSMRAANDANLVGAYAEAHHAHNQHRMAGAGAPGALVSVSDCGSTTNAAHLPPRGPGERFARKSPRSAVSDGIAVAAAANSVGGNACADRCHSHPLVAHAPTTPAPPRSSLTARQVLEDLAFRVRVSQAKADAAAASSLRPNTARSTRSASSHRPTSARPLSGRSARGGGLPDTVTSLAASRPSSASAAAAQREAAETRTAIESFEVRLDHVRRSQRPGSSFLPIRTPVTPDVASPLAATAR